MMVSILDTTEIRWSRALSRWALGTGLAILGVLVTFAVIATSSAGGVLPAEYDELVGAIRLSALYRAATTLDVISWLGLGGFFALVAGGFARRAPLRSLGIAGCGVGQLAGAIGAFTRLAGVSALAARYAITVPERQPALLRSFLDLQLVVGAHFAAGSLLWSLGLLLVASVAWPARLFPRWLAGLVALTGLCNLAGDVAGVVGAPVPFALFILPLILLAASLFGVAVACRTGPPLPRRVGIISRPTQEPRR
jgi:hypothetical protein